MRVAVFVAVGLVLAGFGATAATRLLRKAAAPPFPCVATSKSGWLTASSEGLVLRVEWSETDTRIGAAGVDGRVHWRPAEPAAARALVQSVLQPLDRSIHASTSGKVSVFVACDGKGDYWHGENDVRVGYRDCVHSLPHREALECLKEVYAERSRVSVDEAAGAMIDRMRDVSKALAPRTE